MRVTVSLLMVLLCAEPAESCVPENCDVVPVELEAVSPKADAVDVPTNANVLAWTRTPVASQGFFQVGRPDGGDGDGGVRAVVSVLSSNLCTSLVRIAPAQRLLPDTDYAVRLVGHKESGLSGPIGNTELRFKTGSAEDLDAPSPPTERTRVVSKASCDSCGGSGGGASFAFNDGNFVWVAPIDARFQTSGGTNGFFVPFACAPVVTGLAEGSHQMPVIAFDGAWNQSEVAQIPVEATCTGIDPCTGERATTEVPRLPLGGGGCGCTSTSTLWSLLSAAVLARVFRRRRGWWSGSSGCSVAASILGWQYCQYEEDAPRR